MRTTDQQQIPAGAVAGILAAVAASAGFVVWVLAGMPAPGVPALPQLPGWQWAAIALWPALAGLTGWLAAQRGRSPRAWFALGLALGPFALLAVGLAPVRGSGR